MSKVEMISTGWHRYNGVNLKDGDPFVADSETDADELKVLGFAMRKPAAKGGTYETRVMTAEPPAAGPVGAAEPRAKRQYRKRDLTAK